MTDSQDIPLGYCQCGCGAKTSIAKQTNARYGQVKGQPVRFRVGHATRIPPGERFWSKVDKRGPDECWPWIGWLHPNGYGSFTLGGKRPKRRMAHRVSYELAHGALADDVQIHHKCRHQRCVNPAHLEAVSVKEHAKRHTGDACSKGHPFTPDNSYVYPKTGKRYCRACRAEAAARFRASRPTKP